METCLKTGLSIAYFYLDILLVLQAYRLLLMEASLQLHPATCMKMKKLRETCQKTQCTSDKSQIKKQSQNSFV